MTSNGEQKVVGEIPRLVVVSGLAGAGKTIAIHALEDLGFYCIDNLPAVLLEAFVQKISEGVLRRQRIAVALDARDPDIPQAFVRVASQLAGVCQLDVLFLEAREEVVLKRFRETRRVHPLSSGPTSIGPVVALSDAIELDGRVLAPLRSCARIVIDTSEMTSHYLRQLVRKHFGSVRNGKGSLWLSIVSFGFKHGVPKDLDTIFDVRCFANPHYVESLRPLTGLVEEVRSYVFADPGVPIFVDKVIDFMKFMYPLYEREGKSYFGLGFGCTGGKHRSVAIAERVAELLSKEIAGVTVEHRHFDRE